MKKLFNVFKKEDKAKAFIEESVENQNIQDDFKVIKSKKENEEVNHENSLFNLTNSDWDTESQIKSEAFEKNDSNNNHNSLYIDDNDKDNIENHSNYNKIRKQEQKQVLDSHQNLLNEFEQEENKDTIMTKKTKGEKKGFLSFFSKNKKENKTDFNSSPSEADFLNEEESDKLNTIGLSDSDFEPTKTEFSDFSLDSTTQSNTQEHHKDNTNSMYEEVEQEDSFSKELTNEPSLQSSPSPFINNHNQSYDFLNGDKASFSHFDNPNQDEQLTNSEQYSKNDFAHVSHSSIHNEENLNTSHQDLDNADTLTFNKNSIHDTHYEDIHFDSTSSLNDNEPEFKKSKVSSINDLIKSKDGSKKVKKGVGFKLNSITQAFTNKKKVENNSITNSLGSGAFSINSIESRQKRVWLIGNLPVKTQYTITAGGVVVGIALLLTSALLYNGTKNSVLIGKETAISLNANTQKFATAYNSLLQGGQVVNANSNNNNNLSLISNINKLDKTIDSEINSLNDINDKLGSDALHSQSQLIGQKWQNIKNNTIDLLNSHQNVQLLNYLETSNQKIADLNNYFAQINNYTQQLNNALAQEGNTSAQNNLYAFTLTSQNVNSSLMNVLNSQSYSMNNFDILKQSRALARDNLASIRWNNRLSATTTTLYETLANNWIKYANLVDSSIAYMPSVLTLKEKFAITDSSLQNIEQISNQLSNDYTNTSYSDYSISYALLFLGLIVTLLSIVYTVYIYLFEQGNKSLIDKIENNKNQSAILRLLDEMTPLSSGDLTKMTTVTEEITGVIADSINLTITDLANLVKKIKESVGVMRQKTHEASTISNKMLQDGLEQAKNITSTGNEILNITEAINEISKRTSDSAKEARESASIAKNGETFVRASVDSMNTIKENMDATVKLMLRLDNSSKQISEIVELLSDITEETSVLAVNATLQAVKAGEAGKGFKVVADSVKNLATKAAEATRRVGLLINETQTYINDVVAAVDKTNKEVENGTKLSSDAGKALIDITTSSDSLSKVIDEISKETKRNADITSNISKNITTILQVTEEASESNKSTARSINEIANISNELESSVKQFKVED